MSKYRIKEFKGRFEVQEYHEFIFFGYWKSKIFIVNTILTKSFASIDDALKSVDLMIERDYKDKKSKPIYHDVEDLLHEKGQIEMIKILADKSSNTSAKPTPSPPRPRLIKEGQKPRQVVKPVKPKPSTTVKGN